MDSLRLAGADKKRVIIAGSSIKRDVAGANRFCLLSTEALLPLAERLNAAR